MARATLRSSSQVKSSQVAMRYVTTKEFIPIYYWEVFGYNWQHNCNSSPNIISMIHLHKFWILEPCHIVIALQFLCLAAKVCTIQVCNCACHLWYWFVTLGWPRWLKSGSRTAFHTRLERLKCTYLQTLTLSSLSTALSFMSDNVSGL